MSTERAGERSDVHRITAAPSPRSVDQGVRIRRYLISMSLRTVCVVLAVLVGGPLRWVFVAGAVGLPYVAVVMANAVGSGSPRRPGGPREPHPRVHRSHRDAEPGGTDGKPARRSAEWSNPDSAERIP